MTAVPVTQKKNSSDGLEKAASIPISAEENSGGCHQASGRMAAVKRKKRRVNGEEPVC
jgi:hypothetical protein